MLSSYSIIFLLSTTIIAQHTMAMPAPITVEEDFASFKKAFNRSYATPEEEQKRLEIFRNTSKQIQEHNKKFDAGEVTYTQGINQFADLTPDEIKSTHLRKFRFGKN